jgi:hypothetical protein
MSNLTKTIALATAIAALALPAAASAKQEKVTVCFPKYHKGEIVLKEKQVNAKQADGIPDGTCDPAPTDG